MTFRGLLVVWCVTAVFGAQPMAFDEVTAATHIDFRHQNSPTGNKYLPETMGGGVALFDFDNDGDLDIFLTNGGRIDDPMPPGKKVDRSDRKYWNRLYRNDGGWKFTDVTETA